MKEINTQIIQTGFTLDRLHQDGKIDNEAYTILKDRNKQAINYTRCSELLICLDNGNYEMLTNYKLYTLVSESKGYYNLYDDDGRLVQMSKVRFKKVVAN